MTTMRRITAGLAALGFAATLAGCRDRTPEPTEQAGPRAQIEQAWMCMRAPATGTITFGLPDDSTVAFSPGDDLFDDAVARCRELSPGLFD